MSHMGCLKSDLRCHTLTPCMSEWTNASLVFAVYHGNSFLTDKGAPGSQLELMLAFPPGECQMDNALNQME